MSPPPGEGEAVSFHTGHFYSMTTHARGAIYLDPTARAVLDCGALHGRAILIDERGKVLTYKMTSQCASGSGQFLENIARYLGIAQDEIGSLSSRPTIPKWCRASARCWPRPT
jgi:benzoyl-CoA reductase subunit D